MTAADGVLILSDVFGEQIWLQRFNQIHALKWPENSFEWEEPQNKINSRSCPSFRLTSKLAPPTYRSMNSGSENPNGRNRSRWQISWMDQPSKGQRFRRTFSRRQAPSCRPTLGWSWIGPWSLPLLWRCKVNASRCCARLRQFSCPSRGILSLRQARRRFRHRFWDHKLAFRTSCTRTARISLSERDAMVPEWKFASQWLDSLDDMPRQQSHQSTSNQHEATTKVEIEKSI